jgi:hypothetical protein
MQERFQFHTVHRLCCTLTQILLIWSRFRPNTSHRQPQLRTRICKAQKDHAIQMIHFLTAPILVTSLSQLNRTFLISLVPLEI